MSLFNSDTVETFVSKMQTTKCANNVFVLDFETGQAYLETLDNDIIPTEDLGDEELEEFYTDTYQSEFEECKVEISVDRFSSAPSMFREACAASEKDPLLLFYKRCIKDVYFFIKCLGVTPHWQQRELIDSYAKGDSNISVRSGQGPGKTWCSCVIWLHWLLANRNSLLVVTAPTMRQCKEVWLAEARKIINADDTDKRLQAIYTFTGTGIQMFGCKASDWGCYLATANKAENFQGIHRARLGIHCEEASGLDRQIIETIQGTLSNTEGSYLWLQIGNPNTRSCAFYDTFYAPTSVWTKLHWNGEETPETAFFSQRRNTEVADEFGKDSDVYRVRVKGEFPSLDPNAMLSMEQLIECTKIQALVNAKKENARLLSIGKMRYHLGIDLARFGGDENSITAFEGTIQRVSEAYSRMDPNDAIDRGVVIQSDMGWSNEQSLYIVDVSGMGEGAVGRLGQQKHMGKRVHEFYTQNSADDSTSYADKASEAWFLFRKAVIDKNIYLKYDKRTFDQIANRRYEVTKTGQLKIESKDSYKKRLSRNGDDMGAVGKSPDRADGTIMGFYPVASEGVRIKLYERGD